MTNTPPLLPEAWHYAVTLAAPLPLRHISWCLSSGCLVLFLLTWAVRPFEMGGFPSQGCCHLHAGGEVGSRATPSRSSLP